jgi:protein-tyrosine phosphatase
VAAPRLPCDVTAQALAAADLIVAVKEAEHRPLLAQRFPEWTERVRYWHVDDVDDLAAPVALAQLEELVRALFGEVRGRVTEVSPD